MTRRTPLMLHDAGALCWALCFQFFVAEQIAAHAWKRPYRFATNYISDLGAIHCATTPNPAGNLICSPLHALMNASFLLQGLLIVTGALLLRPHIPLSRAAFVLFTLAGLGVFLVGLFPEDTLTLIHATGAFANFTLAAIGMVLAGLALLRPGRSKPLALFSILGGFTAAAGTAVMLSGSNLGLGAGTLERIAAYPFPIWLTAIGITLLLRRSRLAQ